MKDLLIIHRIILNSAGIISNQFWF